MFTCLQSKLHAFMHPVQGQVLCVTEIMEKSVMLRSGTRGPVLSKRDGRRQQK